MHFPDSLQASPATCRWCYCRCCGRGEETRASKKEGSITRKKNELMPLMPSSLHRLCERNLGRNNTLLFGGFCRALVPLRCTRSVSEAAGQAADRKTDARINPREPGEAQHPYTQDKKSRTIFPMFPALHSRQHPRKDPTPHPRQHGQNLLANKI